MQITTTPGFEGQRITKYFGIVTGEAIMGANIFKDLFAGIRDVVGGRSATYEAELHRARDLALTSCRLTHSRSAPTRSWGSISTTKCSAPATAC